MISFPTGNDISIEINGTKLAVAQGYRAQTTRDSRYVEALGSAEPVAAVGGRMKHILELTRVSVSGAALGDGIDFPHFYAAPERRQIPGGTQRNRIVSCTAAADTPVSVSGVPTSADPSMMPFCMAIWSSWTAS